MKDITKQLPLNGTLKKHRRKAEKKEHGLAKGLHKLFVDELQDIYRSEKALAKAIPKMIKNVTALPLVEALTGQLELAKNNVTILEEAFAFIDEKTESKKCRTMSCLIKNARSVMKETDDGMTKDAAIISAILKVSYYKTATYVTLCSFAEALGENGIAVLLNEILSQAKAANERISGLTKFSINAEAAPGDLSVTEQKQLL
jgi:ferritin-like metal-binding protein YciE